MRSPDGMTAGDKSHAQHRMAASEPVPETGAKRAEVVHYQRETYLARW